MNKRKLLLLISYSCILVYVGGIEWTMPKVCQPVIYFFLGGALYQVAGCLLILSDFYLLLTPFVYPYRKDYAAVACVMLFFWLTLLPDIVYFELMPSKNKNYFLTSIMFFIAVSYYVIHPLVKKISLGRKQA